MTATTDIKDIFEYAARHKLRYPSYAGLLTTEQLFDIPLEDTSKGGAPKANLDDTAKAINTELKAYAEESFVRSGKSPKEAKLRAALEVVKYVIGYKQEQEKLKADKAARATKRAALLEAYEAKQKADLGAMSSEDLLVQLAALEGDDGEQ